MREKNTKTEYIERVTECLKVFLKEHKHTRMIYNDNFIYLHSRKSNQIVGYNWNYLILKFIDKEFYQNCLSCVNYLEEEIENL